MTQLDGVRPWDVQDSRAAQAGVHEPDVPPTGTPLPTTPPADAPLSASGSAARAGAGLTDLRMRPYGVDDRDRLRRMSALLSPQSLYSRFFAGTPQIPEMYVRALHAIDHWDHDALIAMIDDEIIGVAEYVRDREDPQRAEIAVMVADSWQRHGVGGCLVRYLSRLAERRGITEFSADVMLGNATALAAVKAGWPAARPRRDQGAARFLLPLARPVPATREQLHDHGWGDAAHARPPPASAG
jgi:GNAT superfamily N-acetyltransferase